MSLAVGETDLQRLLVGLAPMLAPRPRAIRTQALGQPLPADAIMLFHETEGVTTIVETDVVGTDGVETDGVETDEAGTGMADARWAQITLRIHSSLDAVGMMAAISAALAARSIPCNVVSAYFHDHLFVPWGRREDAIEALEALSRASSERAP